MTFRWFGPTDPIPLAYIRQIPGVTGVVSAVYDTPVGDAWPRASLERLAEQVDVAGLSLAVIESIPVHEDIKLGRPSRDRLVDAWCESVARVGAVGVRVVCYNFMPVFDWMRSNLAMRLPDGSTSLAFDDGELAQFDLSRGTRDLPGWAAAYDADGASRARRRLPAVERRAAVGEPGLLPRARRSRRGERRRPPRDPPRRPAVEHLRPAAHRNERRRARAARRSSSTVPANGVTVCTGSLGADPDNDLPAIIRRLGGMGGEPGRGWRGADPLHALPQRQAHRRTPLS